MEEELKKALADLENKLEQKSKALIEAKKEADSEQIEDVKNDLNKEILELKIGIAEIAKEAKKKKKVESKGNTIQNEIKNHFDSIVKVEKGLQSSERIEIKDITISDSFTGNAPRSYNLNPVADKSPLVNVSDLIGQINITGGTYTFYRENVKSGQFDYQTEGDNKAQIEYEYESVDVTTDFLAGFARYSKKMSNNLPFLMSSIPNALRRDYLKRENTLFSAEMEAQATASAVTTGNSAERLLQEIAVLSRLNHSVNSIVVSPEGYYNLITIEKSTGAGYGLPPVITIDNGLMRINGIPVYQANWVAENKYFVGDFSRTNKIVTQGLSLDFSETEGSNFVKNMITARLEEQNTIAIEQPDALIFGDFTSV